MRRRQRKAISQAQVAKRCDLFGSLCRGVRAFRDGVLREHNPYTGLDGRAWFNGYDAAQEKQNENDR